MLRFQFVLYLRKPAISFTLTADIKSFFCEFEDIHHEIFVPKFQDNMTLPWEVDFIGRGQKSQECIPLQLGRILIKLWKENLLENVSKFIQVLYFLCWYQEYMCPVEPMYFSDEKSITDEK